MIGARSGAQGGPLALEAADVSMVMLAPRWAPSVALRRPAVQRRGALGLGVLAGAVAGAACRSPAPWLGPGVGGGRGAHSGLTVGLAWYGAALVAHGIRADWR